MKLSEFINENLYATVTGNQSTLFKSHQRKNIIVNIYKNPSIKELSAIAEIPSNIAGARGFVDSIGNLYVWRGDWLHSYAKEYFKDKSLGVLIGVLSKDYKNDFKSWELGADYDEEWFAEKSNKSTLKKTIRMLKKTNLGLEFKFDKVFDEEKAFATHMQRQQNEVNDLMKGLDDRHRK